MAGGEKIKVNRALTSVCQDFPSSDWSSVRAAAPASSKEESMGRTVKAAAIAAFTFTLSGVAQAADLPRSYPASAPLPPLLQMAPSLVDEFGSGWYLRGDIGYRFNRVQDVTNANLAAPVTDDNFGRSWLLGIGAGYKWQWFRADVTADYGTKARYAGTTAGMVDDFTVKIDSFSVLANVYGDLGTWFGLTPYIGVGAGGTRLSTSDFSQHFLAPVAAVDSTDKWNFAWAYMAGLSYRVSGNLEIDLGYRHINMGGITTGIDAYGNQLTFRKLAADEVRLGVRYIID
jgi:opacity protein-like surface antigen